MGAKTFNQRRDDSIKSGKSHSGATGLSLEPFPPAYGNAEEYITLPHKGPLACIPDQVKRVIAPHHRDVLFKRNVYAILRVWP